jgi:hypothetical protein
MQVSFARVLGSEGGAGQGRLSLKEPSGFLAQEADVVAAADQAGVDIQGATTEEQADVAGLGEGSVTKQVVGSTERLEPSTDGQLGGCGSNHLPESVAGGGAAAPVEVIEVTADMGHAGDGQAIVVSEVDEIIRGDGHEDFGSLWRNWRQ